MVSLVTKDLLIRHPYLFCTIECKMLKWKSEIAINRNRETGGKSQSLSFNYDSCCSLNQPFNFCFDFLCHGIFVSASPIFNCHILNNSIAIKCHYRNNLPQNCLSSSTLLPFNFFSRNHLLQSTNPPTILSKWPATNKQPTEHHQAAPSPELQSEFLFDSRQHS